MQINMENLQKWIRDIKVHRNIELGDNTESIYALMDLLNDNNSAYDRGYEDGKIVSMIGMMKDIQPRKMI